LELSATWIPSSIEGSSSVISNVYSVLRLSDENVLLDDEPSVKGLGTRFFCMRDNRRADLDDRGVLRSGENAFAVNAGAETEAGALATLA
jgi:hypothetical protein